MIICKYNKETSVFESVVGDGPINIMPHHTNDDMVVIRSGDKDMDIQKKDLLVICNKEGEKANLKKYMETGAKESKVMQKYYKRAEVFYHNFKHDVMIREDIKINEQIDAVEKDEKVETTADNNVLDEVMEVSNDVTVTGTEV